MKNKIKKTKQLIKKLEPYWKELQEIEREYYSAVYRLEKRMSKEIGILGLEFFQCDNFFVGIGNLERTLPLIHARELEK